MKNNENKDLKLVVSNDTLITDHSPSRITSHAPRREALAYIREYTTLEIVTLLNEIREGRRNEPPERLQALGEHAVTKVYKYVPQVFDRYKTAEDFIRNIHRIVMGDVQKVYPRQLDFDFHVISDTPGQLVCQFRAQVASTDYTLGVLYGILDQYGVRETSSIARYDGSLEGNSALFDIRLAHARDVPEKPGDSDEGAAA